MSRAHEKFREVYRELTGATVDPGNAMDLALDAVLEVEREEREAMMELCADDVAFIVPCDGRPMLAINCSDTFDYATADCEIVPPEQLMEVLRRHRADRIYGALKWAVERRGRMPLGDLSERMNTHERAVGQARTEERAVWQKRLAERSTPEEHIAVINRAREDGRAEERAPGPCGEHPRACLEIRTGPCDCGGPAEDRTHAAKCGSSPEEVCRWCESEAKLVKGAGTGAATTPGDAVG